MVMKRKRKLIPYAGWEPQMKIKRGRINVKRALELRAEGLKWRDIGVILAADIGREEPFCSDSVMQTINLYRKAQRENTLQAGASIYGSDEPQQGARQSQVQGM